MRLCRLKDYEGNILAVLMLPREDVAWAWAQGRRDLPVHTVEDITNAWPEGTPVGIVVDIPAEIHKMNKVRRRTLGIFIA